MAGIMLKNLLVTFIYSHFSHFPKIELTFWKINIKKMNVTKPVLCRKNRGHSFGSPTQSINEKAMYHAH